MNQQVANQVTNKQSLSQRMFVFFIIFCAGLGGILYGYDIGVISGALLFVQKSISLTQNQIGFIVGAVLTGGLVGTLITGRLADGFGRKKMIIAACFVFIVGILLILFAKDFYSLFFARLLLGVGVGVVAVAVPLYLTEIAPAHIRGRSVTIFQLLLTFGIVLAYFVDLLFVPSENWRGMFAVILIPAGILFLGMLFLPESPRWLLAKKKDDKAREVLLRTRSFDEAQNEFIQISESLRVVTDNSFRALFARQLWAPLTVALVIAICNQLTGINVLLQYAPLVIKEAGLDSSFGTMMGTVGIGLINFLVTVLAFFLIDFCGRRILLIIGTAGVIIAYVYLGVMLHMVPVGRLQAELSLAGFFAYIFFYAIGPGVVVWLAISELLPTQVRGQAVALGLFANSLAAAILSTTFLMIQNALGMSGTYFLFAGFTVIYFLTALFYLPETKGKTLEEIQAFYKKDLF
jgi:MFS transporter, SP family, galactose:H+ symporter